MIPSCFFLTVPALIGCVLYFAHESSSSQTGSYSSHTRFFLQSEDLRFLGSLFHVELHLFKTENNQKSILANGGCWAWHNDNSIKHNCRISQHSVCQTVNLNNRVKPQLDFGVSVCLWTDNVMNEGDVSAHFHYVRRHGLQWDESGLLHVDLLLIRNYPWKILKREMQKRDTTHA